MLTELCKLCDLTLAPASAGSHQTVAACIALPCIVLRTMTLRQPLHMVQLPVADVRCASGECLQMSDESNDLG